jgi:hypothetical protein
LEIDVLNYCHKIMSNRKDEKLFDS